MEFSNWSCWGVFFYLAYKIATAKPLGEKTNVQPISFYQGLVLNLLNPKAYIVALSVFYQFSIVADYYKFDDNYYFHQHSNSYDIARIVVFIWQFIEKHFFSSQDIQIDKSHFSNSTDMVGGIFLFLGIH